jgi:cell division protein FtsB
MADKIKAWIAPVVFLAITAFFGWGAAQGQHGLLAYSKREALLKQALADQVAAQTEHDDWVRRIYGLQSSHLDRDALDERARAQLNLADPTDIVVPFTGKDRLF